MKHELKTYLATISYSLSFVFACSSLTAFIWNSIIPIELLKITFLHVFLLILVLICIIKKYA